MTKKCRDRIQQELDGRMADLARLWGLGPEVYDEELGNLYEYGLSFDYVRPGELDDLREGYFRYQLSWGGPSDEFRIHAHQQGKYRWSVYWIQYWFLDWFDGAHVELEGEYRELIEDIFQSLFVECGTADHEFKQAMEY